MGNIKFEIEVKKKIKDFINDSRYDSVKESRKKSIMSLGSWINLKMKDFNIYDAFDCIYDKADGNNDKIEFLIKKLTAKDKHYGKRQVYRDESSTLVDIIKDENGNLKYVGETAYTDETPKGQHHGRNTEGTRTKEGNTKEYYNVLEKQYGIIGKYAREAFPNVSSGVLADIIKTIKNLSVYRKKDPVFILSKLKSGKYKYNYEDDSITLSDGTVFTNDLVKRKNESITHRTIFINENVARLIREEKEMTEYKFFSNIKSFLSTLLDDPVNAQPSDSLKLNGLNRVSLIRKLIDNNIIEKDEKISDKDENGNPKTATMKVKYKVPKKNFERKLKKLYIKIFERNLPEKKKKIEEDGEGGCSYGGATSSDCSGQYSQPVFPMQRRKINRITETDTNSVGDYEYDIPFIGDNETLSRKNGRFGSVSVNKA